MYVNYVIKNMHNFNQSMLRYKSYLELELIVLVLILFDANQMYSKDKVFRQTDSSSTKAALFLNDIS